MFNKAKKPHTLGKKRFILAGNTLSDPSNGSSPPKGERNIVILAIETSCDETAAAVLEYTPTKGLPITKTLSSVVKSQIKLHSKMGGVVPEVAARAHIKNILPVVTQALTASHFPLSDIDYIAVTAGPGLIPSLIVGVEFAKALALATKKPILPINHMAGHLYSAFGEVDSRFKIQDSRFPQISLIVSGGHTLLVLMTDAKHYKVIGQTVDDAAGEAFDKVAKLLKLPYPGGPEISKQAEHGNPTAINFPRPMIHNKNYDFSFSGLKTAVLYYLRDNPLTPKTYNLIPNVCASFQAAVIDVLVTKTIRAAKEYRAKSVSLSGGVSANTLLRKTLAEQCQKNHIELFVPPFRLSTDNAEMIGIAAAFYLNNGGKPVPFSRVKADPNLSL
jgi:N6-L-threonylcarbamoyladenine synthase